MRTVFLLYLFIQVLFRYKDITKDFDLYIIPKTLCFNNGIKVIEAISQDKAEVDLVKVVTNICNVRTNEVK
jgi:hypothetical protein